MSKVIWFTGMSGSGKTTYALKLKKYLLKNSIDFVLLDGDIVRQIYNKPLFTREGRIRNIDLIRVITKAIKNTGYHVIVAAITPYEKMRQKNRKVLKDDYIEIYCKCDLKMLIKRDVKGLYKKALNGEIKHFTGIDDPFDEPDNPMLVLNTAGIIDEEKCFETLLSFLKEKVCL